MSKGRFVAAVVSLLALALVLVPSVRADTSDLAADWNEFVAKSSVYDVLENLGPIVWNGPAADVGHLAIVWQNKVPTILVNGCPVLNTEVRYERGAVTLKGYFAGDLDWPLQAKLSLDSEGNLVVETSGFAGENGRQFIFAPDSGLLIAAPTCLCWGGTATTTKKACTVAMCNDPDQCSTNPGAAQAYCQWRQKQPAVSGK